MLPLTTPSMATRRYTIYCDESSKKGKRFANFYGGALMATSDVDAISELLNRKKEELNLYRELKWTGVSAPYQQKYIDFIEYFFEFIKSGRIKIRIMFTSNRIRPQNLTSYHEKNRYFVLYYQFIKNGFGLIHCNPNTLDRVFIELRLDQIPDTKQKVEEFRNFVNGIGVSASFFGRQIFFPKDSIFEIDSKKHVISQGLDIILGSMQSRLNGFHLIKPDGGSRRGKRTLAKEKVYKAINNQIRDIYPNFNIGITTGQPNGIDDRWNHPYRHWVFKPRDWEMTPPEPT